MYGDAPRDLNLSAVTAGQVDLVVGGTDADFVGFFTHVKGKAAENEKIATQVQANSEKQFLASPDLKGSVIKAMVSASDNFAGMTAEALDDDAKLAKLVELVGRALFRDGKDVA